MTGTACRSARPGAERRRRALFGEQNIGLCLVIPDDGRIEAALQDAGSLELFELHSSIDSALTS